MLVTLLYVFSANPIQIHLTFEHLPFWFFPPKKNIKKDPGREPESLRSAARERKRRESNEQTEEEKIIGVIEKSLSVDM